MLQSGIFIGVFEVKVSDPRRVYTSQPARERMSKLLCVDQQYKWAWPRLNYNKGKNLLPARAASEPAEWTCLREGQSCTRRPAQQQCTALAAAADGPTEDCCRHFLRPAAGANEDSLRSRRRRTRKPLSAPHSLRLISSRSHAALPRPAGAAGESLFSF